MDAVDYVVLVTRWLHLLAAMIIVGGSVFMWFTAASKGDSDMPDGSAQAGEARRWAKVVHPCIAILLLIFWFGGFFRRNI